MPDVRAKEDGDDEGGGEDGILYTGLGRVVGVGGFGLDQQDSEIDEDDLLR